jgi:raffinose/stachyose/melibiose transport system substrate-binding protein
MSSELEGEHRIDPSRMEGGSMVRRSTLIAALVAVVAAAVASGVALAATSTHQAKVTLTLWHNYGTEGNAIATENLVKAFEKQNPNITINVVSQPASNYFALLQASGISHTGPDLAVMWTGLFDIKYQKLLLNLKPYFSAAQMNKINGLKWVAPNFDPSKGFLVMPLEDQFYMGFYNKALFKKAGVSSVPQNWSQLYAACSKLQKIGVAPIVYGADPQAISSSPYPFYDFSYIMAGLYSPSQWKGLYTGQIPWTSPNIVSQVSNWAALPKKGCTNSDVLTKTNILGAFIKGQAAMIIDGNWDTATLQKAMGSKVAPFVPPFTSKPQKGVVQYAGDGFSVMSYTKHPKEAVAFLRFMMTPTAAKIVSAAGLIPDIKGFKTSNPVSNQMLAFAAAKGLTPYPMIDNVIQSEVVTTGMKQLDAALGGDISAQAALSSMKSTLSSLPASRRGSVYR